MSQDTFNKIVTAYLILYFSALEAVSWYTGKQIDLLSLSGFIIPLVTHGLYIVNVKNSPNGNGVKPNVPQT